MILITFWSMIRTIYIMRRLKITVIICCQFLLPLSILMLNSTKCFSQRYTESYISIQGTYDKVRDAKRANFARNNFLLNRQFSDQFFNQFFPSFIRMGAFKNITINATTGLTFTIVKNNVDSIRVIKSSGLSLIDSATISMLRSTSGKWTPGKINDSTVEESITLWVHIFFGVVGDRSLGACIKSGNAYMATEDYKKAIKEYDKALYYDELNTNAMKQKGLALIKMGNKSEACALWKSFEQYDNPDISTLLKENCQ